MSQPPVVYVQQQGSGCGRVLFWLLMLFVVAPAVMCAGWVVLGLLFTTTDGQ
ncbi:hypothetical protein ACWD69_09370 [Micromonospora chokoriensis]